MALEEIEACAGARPKPAVLSGHLTGARGNKSRDRRDERTINGRFAQYRHSFSCIEISTSLL